VATLETKREKEKKEEKYHQQLQQKKSHQLATLEKKDSRPKLPMCMYM
jgi:hypothetical protein